MQVTLNIISQNDHTMDSQIPVSFFMKERSKNPATKMVARERISVLFEQARLAFREHPERSNRYVALARRIAMRQRIRMDRELRRQYCHHCYAFLAPGHNMRVRVHRGNVVVTCLVCNKKTRFRVVRPDGQQR
jgi:ribonuclease P protein subunit RPR2